MPKALGLKGALKIGKHSTRIQRERERVNRQLVAEMMPKPERYRDITSAVQTSNTVVGKRSSGQRGRTRDWSASDYLLSDDEPFLNCGEDIAADASTKTQTITVEDVFAFLSEETQETAVVDAITKAAKKYRTRTKEANECDSLSDISPLLLVSFEDENENEAQAAGFCLASHADA